ncbi:hypothetical protein [Kitasatospora purpeofusca]|uniref:hypothetical protein n=1 Tax=Kitasatospora purpeofusca TaxID=67352 RepID=UPI00368905D2
MSKIVGISKYDGNVTCTPCVAVSSYASEIYAGTELAERECDTCGHVLGDTRLTDETHAAVEHTYGEVIRLLDEADAHGWTRLALVMDHTDSLLPDGEGWVPTDAQRVLEQSNWAAALEIMEKACGESGGHWDECGGQIMYDADNHAAREAAEGIASALSNYPILDETDHSEREWNAMVEEVEGSPVTLPPDVDGEDVLRALDCPQLDCITMDMVESAVEGMGYVQCSDCDEWLTPDGGRKRSEPLCRTCALDESRPDTVGVWVPEDGDVTRARTVHGQGEPLTAVLTPYLDGWATEHGCAYREDVRAIVRGSAVGYRQTYSRAA